MRKRIQGTYLNIIKGIYNKPTVNIKLNGEKTQSDLTLSIFIQYSTYVPARTIRQQKEIKLKNGEEGVKLSLFADNRIVYMSDPKISTRELLQLIKTFSSVPGYKVN